MTYTCISCKVEIKGFPSRPRKYCSKKCEGLDRAGSNNSNYKGLDKLRVCSCGQAKDHRANSCSSCTNRSTPVGAPRMMELTPDLCTVIKSSSSIVEAAKRTGLNRKTVSRLAADLDKGHMVPSARAGRLQGPEVLVLHDRSRNNAVVKRVLLDNDLLPYLCSLCGQTAEHNGFPLVLQLDHINGNFRDDRIENLRFLCPNCHSQTPTYCGGKTKGMKKLRKRKEPTE